MLQIVSNARLKTLKPVQAVEIDMRMKSLYRLWSMNGGSAVPVDSKEWCGNLTVGIVVRMVMGKAMFQWRTCPGISFALHVIYLALARVIHGFDLVVPSDALIKMSRAINFGTRNSDPIQVMFNPRLSQELYE
ncbi:hypothetical protein AAC387_Pa04g2163 [Persea americana]